MLLKTWAYLNVIGRFFMSLREYPVDISDQAIHLRYLETLQLHKNLKLPEVNTEAMMVTTDAANSYWTQIGAVYLLL